MGLETLCQELAAHRKEESQRWERALKRRGGDQISGASRAKEDGQLVRTQVLGGGRGAGRCDRQGL